MSDIDSPFLTLDETAALLRTPVATLYAWRSRGEGPPSRKVGRRVLYRRDEVLAWADSKLAA